MSERETHDFMSVDSFSQLPFMRREKPPNPPIRLFGFDFPPEPSAAPSDTSKRRSSSPSPADLADSGETVRRFECNYCFRNFPTSQALGGHQNAHKRERQHAKRANLAAASAEGHLQGLLGYHGMPASPPQQLHYPSWSFSAGSGGVGVRFYGGLGSVTQPINGNPMPGPWQALPASTHHLHRRNHFLAVAPPLLPPSSSFASLGGDQERRTASARERHGREAKDAVSLDLHL